ncbi:heme-binding protein [Mycobacterium sp. HM-7]
MKRSTRVTGLIPMLAAVPMCLGLLTPTTAAAEADCSPDAVANTVSSATGAASNYLTAHPDANQVVVAAYSQPRPVASANLRAYFTAHPQQYQDLRGILAPIGDTQQRCNVTVLSPEMATAYAEFMAG